MGSVERVGWMLLLVWRYTCMGLWDHLHYCHSVKPSFKYRDKEIIQQSSTKLGARNAQDTSPESAKLFNH